jgi:hypothetical protein
MSDKKEGEAYYRSTASYLKAVGPDVLWISEFF